VPRPVSRHPRPPRRLLFGSRFALAASAALLLLCGWLLGGKQATSPEFRPPAPDNGSAERPELPGLPKVKEPQKQKPAGKGKVSSLTLEHARDGHTGVKVIVEEPPPNK
jgi:hypothetical protein